MARTSDIGLRRLPHPPMPIVMPERELGDDLVGREPLVATHFEVSVSRLSTNASRCSSATPDRLSSKVKPCSYR